LRIFAQVLTKSLRPADLIARHGGEEFAIAFPDATLEDAAAALANLQTTLQQEIVNAGLPSFTVSVGVVEAHELDEDLASVLARADRALFAAKDEGRDRVVFGDRDEPPTSSVGRGPLTVRQPLVGEPILR
jgi:diguanylate cyclase (GGDEF)-like protein